MIRFNLLAFIAGFLIFFEPKALAENSVAFEGVGTPGFLTIEGKGAKVKPTIKTEKDGKVSGIFEVDLKALDTGIALRNDHMRDKYLEVGKFPTAKLVLSPIAMPKQGIFNWSGMLTLHGVTRKVEGVATIEGKQVEAKFSIETPDYSIKKAMHMGVGLDDKINLVVRFDYPS